MSMLKDFLKTIILSATVLFLVGIAYAWTEPSSNPPSGNTSAPITTGSSPQTKPGWLTLDYLETYGNTYLATTAGNVGIGTTAPGAKLEVAGDLLIRAGGAATAALGNLNIRNDNIETVAKTYSTNNSSDIIHNIYYVPADNYMRYYDIVGLGNGNGTQGGSTMRFFTNQNTNDNGVVRMVINNNGNVGIGTTGPGEKLDVAGRIKSSSGGFVFPDNTVQTSAASGGLGGSGTTNYLSKFTAGTTIGNSVIYDNGTNVGIGTTAPSHKLTVSGDIRVTGGAILAEDSVYLAASAGNVGIGTTSPGAKLDINGKMRFRSSFTKYDSYGPYSSYPGGGPFWNDGATWGCTCRNSQNRYIDSNTCNFNSLMSGGNNTTSCIYTATIANTTIFNKIIECGIGDFNGTFQCTVIQ